MENKWIVKVSHYHEFEFVFDTAEEAIKFAEFAVRSAQPYTDYNGKVHDVEISISAIIKSSKEDSENE